MSLLAGLLLGVGILVWPGRFGRHQLSVLSQVSRPSSGNALAPARADSRGQSGPEPRLGPGRWARFARRSAGERAGDGRTSRWQLSSHRRFAPEVTAQELLGLLEAIAPALEAGMAPAAALRYAADARSGAGGHDRLAALAATLALAAADGATLGPLWREAAESEGSAELLQLAQAWSLTEDLGAPLAQAVRTTAGLLEARIAHQRQLAAAVAGARATVNVLTVLPIAGPLLALFLGIGPAQLYGGSRLTQASLVLGVCLAGLGRWWVHRMVLAVARGPVIG